MPPKRDEDLEAFLKRQDPSTLVGILIELADKHESVQVRLARLTGRTISRPGFARR